MYDALLGVGKTPQITGDIELNPYTAFMDNITTNAVGTYEDITGSSTVTGSYLNTINENFDYNAYTSWLFSMSGGGQTKITYDLGKCYNLRAVTSYINLTAAVSGGVTWEYSTDGLNWINASQIIVAGVYTNTNKDLDARYIRLNWGHGSGANTLTIYRFDVRINSIQKFY